MKLYAVVSFIHAFMSVDFHGIEKTKFHVHNGPNNSKWCHTLYILFQYTFVTIALINNERHEFKIGV